MFNKKEKKNVKQASKKPIPKETVSKVMNDVGNVST